MFVMLVSFGILIVGVLLEVGDWDIGWMVLILLVGCLYVVILVCYVWVRVVVGWLL